MKIIKRILKIIGIIVITFITMMIILVSIVNSALSSDKGNNEKILESTKLDKKALIIYQPSLSKMTSKISGEIAKGLNESGYEVVINYPGEHLSTDLSKYDIVIFGSPTYGGKISNVLTKYISKVKDYSSNVKVVLFSTGLNTSETELDEMENYLNNKKATKKIKINSKNGYDDAYKLGIELSE